MEKLSKIEYTKCIMFCIATLFLSCEKEKSEVSEKKSYELGINITNSTNVGFSYEYTIGSSSDSGVAGMYFDKKLNGNQGDNVHIEGTSDAETILVGGVPQPNNMRIILKIDGVEKYDTTVQNKVSLDFIL